MASKKLSVSIMFWYKKMGRIIYSLLFFLSLILTGFLALHNSSLTLSSIIFNFGLLLIALLLEVYLIQLSHKGTKHIEVNRNVRTYELDEITAGIHKYFTIEKGETFIVKVSGEPYNRDYKKYQVSIKEDKSILNPSLVITSIEKISKAADNEYSVFAVIGEKNIISEVQIIVKSIELDVNVQ